MNTVCIACHRDIGQPIAGLCATCTIRASRLLHDIRATWYKAHAELKPGIGSRGASAEPKIGVNVTALSWIEGSPILGILHSWERLIREERHLAPVGLLPKRHIAAEIDQAVTFHIAHLDWTAGQPWADDFLQELRDLQSQGHAACREAQSGMRIDCPGELPEGGICGRRLNVPTDPEAIVHCRQCGTDWDQRRLAAVAMAVVDVEVLIPIADVVHHTGIPERTIRDWVKRGIIRKHGDRVSIKDVRVAREIREREAV